jgi:hypothetical protein
MFLMRGEGSDDEIAVDENDLNMAVVGIAHWK